MATPGNDIRVEGLRWFHRAYPYPGGALRDAAAEAAIVEAYLAGYLSAAEPGRREATSDDRDSR